MDADDPTFKIAAFHYGRAKYPDAIAQTVMLLQDDELTGAGAMQPRCGRLRSIIPTRRVHAGAARNSAEQMDASSEEQRHSLTSHAVSI